MTNEELMGVLGITCASFLVIALCFIFIACSVYYYLKNKQIVKENEEEENEKQRFKREIKEAVFQDISRYYGGFKYEEENKKKPKKKD